MEFTSQGQGTLNTVLGAVGTYGTLFNGGLGNLFGGGSNVAANGQNVIQNILDVVDLKTENAILKAKADTAEKIAALDSKVDNIASAQAVINCGYQSAISVLQSQVSQVMGMTKIVIPNDSICPGWTTTTSTT